MCERCGWVHWQRHMPLLWAFLPFKWHIFYLWDNNLVTSHVKKKKNLHWILSNPCSDLLSLSSSLLSPKLGPLPVDNFDYVNPLLAIALLCEFRHWSWTPNSCSVCSPMKWNYEKKPGPVVLDMKEKANQNVLLYMIYFWLLASFQLTGLTGLLNHWLGFRSVML